ncbi:MAG TPA: M23 family metallopeptidase [Streptosporangiaceae bacterium]|nr:M23 family metallopeptidase [Streptosporangiaceae bacterium]
MLIVTCVLVAMLPFGPGDWRWPLSPEPPVLRDYDPPPRPWLSGHRGVDLAARPGQSVYAAGPGRVGYAGRLAGRGIVTVLHGALRTSYLPLRPAVRRGQRVAAGQRLGQVEDVRGHCGRVLCLHWGLRRGLAYLDPLSLLGGGTIRLLPVWPAAGADHPPAAARPGSLFSPSAASRPPPRAPRAVSAGRASLDRGRSMVTRSATAAGGGALAGAILAYLLILAWRRMPARRRLPPGVIDLTRERHRRHPSA